MSRHVRIPRALAALAGLAGLLAAGCNVGPKYTRPQVPVPPTIRGADNSEVASDPQGSLGDQQWAQVFKQPELQTLIATALKNNFDLRVAAERVLEQQAQVRITRAQQFPQLSIGGAGIGSNIFAAVGSCIATTSAFGCIDATASWTPDFWGLYRRQTEAARAAAAGAGVGAPRGSSEPGAGGGDGLLPASRAGRTAGHLAGDRAGAAELGQSHPLA